MRRLTRRLPTITRKTPSRAILPLHDDGDISLLNDTLIDEGREPVIMPTGVLNAEGHMLVRVHMPVKLKCGFHIPGTPTAPTEPLDDYAAFVISENELMVSDTGIGIGFVTPAEAAEMEGPDENETEMPAEIDGVPVIGTSQNGMPVVKLSDVIRKLTTEGIAVALDLNSEGQIDG